MRKLTGVITGLLCAFLFQNISFANMIGDAPGYGRAYHKTAEWQRLGESNHIDDGVLWSTDGGTSWGNDAVTIGDTITFQFKFWTAGYGNHRYDQLRAWADTDHSFTFDADEELIYRQQWKKRSAVRNDRRATQAQLDRWNKRFSTYTYIEDASLFVTPDMADGFWMRARVHCNRVRYPNIPATGYLSQGETEDWFVNVNPVPEPATLILLGFGLIGLSGALRKKNKK